ncbi:tRNA pseudouridine(13) synthase TruD [Thalassotalea agarivorans]|uniref:tRNA pseudouridine synthase D n=1 Tax=Thalassotalea agarivorans TaxID=349064 RepID=A0A1H9ZE02_THASX|nr:tRNA pseudouridine(13) synthase TruD [Thalassotalea agarivorans]SES79812.1 tRNA pseudouridine13 synthase [Thalassotalea agarivorans]
MKDSWAFLHGKPTTQCQMRSSMADFQVDELLPFEPCGEGEHYLLHIEKTGANTVFVARQLAKFFDVKEKFVSYAGLKDRFAVTTQWFGVHVPGKQTYDFDGLQIEGVKLLQAKRHNKKLKTGALLGNKFTLVLRNVSDANLLAQRWEKISKTGVPNYFGEQRFGIEGNNIAQAKAMFDGKRIKDKKKRSIYLSAARSLIFNDVVSKRIAQSHFEQPILGDVFMLSGTQSIFAAEKIDDDIIDRFNRYDIDITAPLWGKGELASFGQAAEIEQMVADAHQDFCDGLKKFGLKQERRRIRLMPEQTNIAIAGDDVTLTFFLPAGCFATTILRELTQYEDLTQRAQHDG